MSYFCLLFVKQLSNEFSDITIRKQNLRSNCVRSLFTRESSGLISLSEENMLLLTF